MQSSEKDTPRIEKHPHMDFAVLRRRIIDKDDKIIDAMPCVIVLQQKKIEENTDRYDDISKFLDRINGNY